MSSGGIRANAGARGSTERIYTSVQLVQALRSGLAAVRDQLQCLNILDGTALSWPGVKSAIDDMEFLVDVSSKTVGRLETDAKTLKESDRELTAEVGTLKETLAAANNKVDDLSREVATLNKENRSLSSRLDAANKEASQLKQELWALEKQRADLASDLERFKQDNEFMEGEISTLRSQVSEQLGSLGALKEELAARNSDVKNLRELAHEQKQAVDALKTQLDNTTAQLQSTQVTLHHTRSEKEHLERESDRLADENARLASELTKSMKEVSRLKEWQEVLKKVEADKLREAEEKGVQAQHEWDGQKAGLEKTIALLQSDVANREAQLRAKTGESEGHAKQATLLNLQIKDLQKQVAGLSAERTAAAKAREEARGQVHRLQLLLQQNATRVQQADKDRQAGESRIREAAQAERIRLQAAIEEGRKENMVQKALADGWSRDLKEIQAQLKAEQERAAGLQEQIAAYTRQQEQEKYNNVKESAATEQMVRDLRAQVASKEELLRKVRYEAQAVQKSLEKQLEGLQRECNESAMVIERIRNGRLPPLNKPPSLQDELENLKRMVAANRSASSGPTLLTPVMRGPQPQQHQQMMMMGGMRPPLGMTQPAANGIMFRTP